MDTGTVTNFKVAESKMVSEAIATFAEFQKRIVNRTLKRQVKDNPINLIKLALAFFEEVHLCQDFNKTIDYF